METSRSMHGKQRLAMIDKTCTIKSVKSLIHSCCASDNFITHTVNHGIMLRDDVKSV